LRSGGKVVSVPVLGAVAVLADGSKQLLALELCGSESHQAWKGFLDDLVARGLKPPALCIVDGNPGLRGAVELIWPKADVQRCAVHKLRNLLAQGTQARARGDRRRLPRHRIRRERGGGASGLDHLREEVEGTLPRCGAQPGRGRP
jgi:transposase-like protein